MSQQEAMVLGKTKLHGSVGYPELKVSQDLLELLITLNPKFNQNNTVREAATPAGKADILTPHEVIEVKKGSDYKHAVGQVLFYHAHLKQVYPKAQMAVALYDVSINNLGVIVTGFQSLNINLYILYDKTWYYLPHKVKRVTKRKPVTP